MNALLLYNLKAAFFLAGFFMVYRLFLSGDTLYMRNRLFILFSIVFSLILPIVEIRTANPVNLQFFGKTFSEVFVRASQDAAFQFKPAISNPDWRNILGLIYLAGVLAFGSKLIFDLGGLLLLFGRKKDRADGIITFHGLNTAGFSAFGFIFINDELPEAETREIVRHEQRHIDQVHFLDIMFVETVKVFQWFNPFIYLLDRSMRAVHEFQADQGCLSSGIPLVNYQKLILNTVFRSKIFNITSNFSYPTLIKRRMIMMTKKRSRTLTNLKLLMVLPVIAILLIAFSSCKAKNDSVGTNSKEVAPPPPPPPPPPAPFTVSDGDTTWAVVDVMPEFKGGDKAIIDYLTQNTKYPEAAKENGITGKVIVRFCVEPDGKITKCSVLKGVDPALDNEALRVVSSMPAFESPGMNKGKPVAVWFMVPINFALK